MDELHPFSFLNSDDADDYLVSKASRTGVSQTGLSKKVLEQVREGLRISLQAKRRFDFGGLVGWAILKKHAISWLPVAFQALQLFLKSWDTGFKKNGTPCCCKF